MIKFNFGQLPKFIFHGGRTALRHFDGEEIFKNAIIVARFSDLIAVENITKPLNIITHFLSPNSR